MPGIKSKDSLQMTAVVAHCAKGAVLKKLQSAYFKTHGSCMALFCSWHFLVLAMVPNVFKPDHTLLKAN